jgi:hypothetical protein
MAGDVVTSKPRTVRSSGTRRRRRTTDVEIFGIGLHKTDTTSLHKGIERLERRRPRLRHPDVQRETHDATATGSVAPARYQHVVSGPLRVSR